MKRANLLALLGLTFLTAMPSVAHGRYRDGMNLYEYVRSSPAGHIDWNGAGAVSTTRSSTTTTSAPAVAPPSVHIQEHLDSLAKLKKGNPSLFWHYLRVDTGHGALHAVTNLTARTVGTGGAYMAMDFVPSKDVKECSCKKIEVLQMVKNLVGGKPYFINPKDANRKYSAQGGWYIDRWNEPPSKSPYYIEGALKRDPKSHMQQGASPQKPAVARDAPRGHNSRKGVSGQMLVTCVVCTEGPDAARGVNVYGCFSWGWIYKEKQYMLLELQYYPSFPSKMLEAIKQWNLNPNVDKIHLSQQVTAAPGT